MKPLIVANWKCNPTTLKEAKLLFNSVASGIKNLKNVEVVICPPFVYISGIKHQTSNIKLGAQDIFWEEKGAYTGEVSPAMLKDLGCQYVIVGHSERRKLLKETDKMVNNKLRAALGAGLKPILCVGSNDKDQEKEFTKIKMQLERGLVGIKQIDLKNIIVAYEPIWAISTTKGSKIANPYEARKGASFIRKILIKLFGKNSVQRTRIIYGGSVNSKNIKGFIKDARMDGVLVGAAFLKSEEFIAAVKNVTKD